MDKKFKSNPIFCENPKCSNKEKILDIWRMVASDRPYINLTLCLYCYTSLTQEEKTKLIWKKKLEWGKKILGRQGGGLD